MVLTEAFGIRHLQSQRSILSMERNVDEVSTQMDMILKRKQGINFTFSIGGEMGSELQDTELESAYLVLIGMASSISGRPEVVGQVLKEQDRILKEVRSGIIQNIGILHAYPEIVQLLNMWQENIVELSELNEALSGESELKTFLEDIEEIPERVFFGPPKWHRIDLLSLTAEPFRSTLKYWRSVDTLTKVLAEVEKMKHQADRQMEMWSRHPGLDPMAKYLITLAWARDGLYWMLRFSKLSAFYMLIALAVVVVVIVLLPIVVVIGLPIITVGYVFKAALKWAQHSVVPRLPF